MIDHVTVLLDGDLVVTPDLIKQARQSYVIAADGGIRHAKELKLTPTLWIGDFDSASSADLKQYEDVRRITLPAAKAKSDGELAVDEALALNPSKITLLGALGGKRTDHAFFNALNMLHAAIKQPDITFEISNGYENAYPLVPGKSLNLQAFEGSTLSIIPFSKLEGLSITGVKWPLHDVTIELGSSHTLSNVAAGNVTAKLANGHAIAIVQTII